MGDGLHNLHKNILELNEEMEVYVRIKPCDGNNSIFSISGNHIIVQPPKDSISFKNRNNAGTKSLQKFKFNKIYDSSINQEELFKDSALNLVQDFLMGKNTLLFTYGATSAGKTYTMLGSVRNAGLIPRSMDVMFNSLEGQLLENPILKPLGLTEFMKLNINQVDAEEGERSILRSPITSGSIKDWNIRARDNTVCPLQHPRDYFSVWVSYCEIYNEQAFDLLDGCDKKKKRIPLRITEDRKGKFFVKGLKEICVHSADDAVRVMLYGKENLHFAATKLNHNSSRSHCVFTVKMIRTNHFDDPTEATISMMSFVDLAGMEPISKTQSRGERLKEAGNINTSLLILGRCIDAMRSNQQNHTNKTIIPYRESKLTRILQHFFSGQGRAAMFVNVSPSPILCDETLHVLKLGALAQEVIIQHDRVSAPPLRPSRFQQYVRKSISMLSARESEDSRADLQQEMTQLQFEAAASNKPKINFCGPETDGEDVEATSDNLVASLQAKLASKEEMLNEAVLEYHTKSEELDKALQENEQLRKELDTSNEEQANLQTEIERCNLLLSDANERLDVREEELMNLEEKLMKANGQYGNINTELQEAKRRIRDLESKMKEQNNASMVSTMCEDLQKQLLEAESKLDKRKEDIERLRDELARCKDQIRAHNNAQEELENLRDRFSKSQLQLASANRVLAVLQEANEDIKAHRESLLDQISHLKKDLELSCTERKQDEGSHSNLLQDNSRMHRSLSELRTAQAKMTEENDELRKAMTDHESTIKELTDQIKQLKEIQREHSLMEEELKTLAATLGRVQLEKNQLEKDHLNQKAEIEQMRNRAQQLEKENVKLQEDGQRCDTSFKEELQRLREGLKCSSESTLGSVSKIASLEAELSDVKEKMAKEKLDLEKKFQNKFDQLEKEKEILTIDMLKHLKRASELSESLHETKEELMTKTLKCDSLLNRVAELESQSSNFKKVESQLVEKEIAIREKENTNKSVLEELGKKEVQIEELKQQNERVLREKNQDISRLELELKSILSGHVSCTKPTIKIEEVSENDPPQEENLNTLLATPTPARVRRGRAKNVSPPGSLQKENDLDDCKSDVSSLCGSTRSRRTIKSDFAAPTSSTKTSGRKPRKAHPALSVTRRRFC